MRDWLDHSRDQLPTPSWIASHEKFVSAHLPWMPVNQIKLGASIDTVALDDSHLRSLIKSYDGEAYLAAKQPDGVWRVALGVDATPRDQLKAFFHTVCTGPEGNDASEAARVTQERFEGFYAALKKAGWSTDNFLLGVQEWRLKWEPEGAY